MVTIFPTPEQSRIIDNAKAIGIILVVVGHYTDAAIPFDYFNPYLFHMQLFFFLGGMLARPERALGRTTWIILKKHIFYIIIAFVLIGLLANILNNLGFQAGQPFQDSLLQTVRHTLKSNFDNNPYFLVAWFLFAYSISSWIGVAILKIINKTSSDLSKSLCIAICSISFSVVGVEYLATRFQAEQAQNLNLSAQVFVGLGFFLAGYLLRKRIFGYLSIVGYLISFYIIFLLKNLGYNTSIGMSWSRYGDGIIVSSLAAFSGIYCTFFLAKFLTIARNSSWLANIGQNSKHVMTLHLLAFLMIDIVLSAVGIYDAKTSTAMKHFYSPAYYALYVVGGVLIPIYLAKTYDIFISKAAEIYHRII